MNKLFLFIMMCTIGRVGLGQAYNPAGKAWDETNNIALNAGTSIIADPTADGGNAIYRPASAERATAWFGPYHTMQAGNYMAQFRLKVSSNVSSAILCTIDVISLTGGVTSNALAITPSMFRASNEWQIFSIPMQVSGNAVGIEMRGLDFIPGITDLYLDYINIIPGDLRGFYSNEFSIDPKGNVFISGVIRAKSAMELSDRVPFQFTHLGDGVYNRGVFFITSEAGMGIERPRLSDNANAAVTSFRISKRGGGIPAFYIDGEDKVGIGTSSPTQKLSVEGTILAKKVKVSQASVDWPDYVFDSSYQLPSLDSVSSFIQVNKHLPDMPSAATVEKDGHDLGEVQKLLLKKMEEMTLYMIELKKENLSIKNENKEMREEIRKIKNDK